MKEINYSIIIPHKNTPELLERCLASIPRREDMQVIIVDDNSDENYVDFECFPGLGEPCVEIYFTKENKGAGYARNIGMKYAKGRWLLFADADDFFNQKFIETIDKYKDSSYDIIYFSVNSVFSDNLKKADRGNLVHSMVMEALKSNDLNLLRYKRYQPWSKMISRELIRQYNLYFEERIIANDIWFSVTSGYYAKNVKADLTQLYCLTVREGSLELVIDSKTYFNRIEAACNVNDFLKNRGLFKYRFNICLYMKNCSKLGFAILIKLVGKIFSHYNGYYSYLLYDLYHCIIRLFSTQDSNFRNFITIRR